MSYTNISFPCSLRYRCNPQDDQLLCYRNVDINNAPMFNPLTYESVIPYPRETFPAQNNFSRFPRDFGFGNTYDDIRSLNLPCNSIPKLKAKKQ